MHPLIERVEQALAGLVPTEPLEIRGDWSRLMRRTYRDASQAGSGTGPFADVVDVFWKATVDGTHPVAGIGFLHAGHSLYWVKSSPASLNLIMQISLHAYANFSLPGATFTAGLGNSFLPGVPVSCGRDLETACALGPAHAATGRAHRVAEIDGVAFVVVLIQGALLKTGRNHLWRLRDRLASNLPADVRDLLTRRRSGAVNPV